MPTRRPKRRATGPPRKHVAHQAIVDATVDLLTQTATGALFRSGCCPSRRSKRTIYGGGSRRRTCRARIQRWSSDVIRSGHRRRGEDSATAPPTLHIGAGPGGHGRPSVNGCRARNSIPTSPPNCAGSRVGAARSFTPSSARHERGQLAQTRPDTAIDLVFGPYCIACSSRTLRWTAGFAATLSTTCARPSANERPQTPIIPGSGRTRAHCGWTR